MTQHKPLNARELRFVDAYLTIGIGADAARLAGYSTRTANVIAAQLLARPRIRAAITERQARASKEADLTVDWVISRLMIEADGKGSDTTQSGRVRALELLAKRLNMFPPQQLEHSSVPHRVVGLSELLDQLEEHGLTDTGPGPSQSQRYASTTRRGH